MALFSRNQKNVPGRRRDGVNNDRVQNIEIEQRNTFKRNRTLTGSSSSNVNSVSGQNADLKSARTQAHELVKKRRSIGATFTIVFLCSAALYALISQFTAGVAIKPKGDVSVRLDGSYEVIVQDYLSKRPIERLRFMVDEKALGDYLQATAPEVESVTTEGAAGFGKSSFVVTMRRPIVSWNINGTQQYVDATGTAFSRNYFANPAIQVIDNSGLQAENGQTVVSNRFLGFIGKAVGEAKKHGYETSKVIIPSDASRQIQLKFIGVSYPVKLSVDRVAEDQVGDMVKAINWLKSRHKHPKYLDVRIESKAYYK